MIYGDEDSQIPSSPTLLLPFVFQASKILSCHEVIMNFPFCKKSVRKQTPWITKEFPSLSLLQTRHLPLISIWVHMLLPLLPRTFYPFGPAFGRELFTAYAKAGASIADKSKSCQEVILFNPWVTNRSNFHRINNSGTRQQKQHIGM